MFLSDLYLSQIFVSKNVRILVRNCSLFSRGKQNVTLNFHHSSEFIKKPLDYRILRQHFLPHPPVVLAIKQRKRNTSKIWLRYNCYFFFVSEIVFVVCTSSRLVCVCVFAFRFDVKTNNNKHTQYTNNITIGFYRNMFASL